MFGFSADATSGTFGKGVRWIGRASFWFGCPDQQLRALNATSETSLIGQYRSAYRICQVPSGLADPRPAPWILVWSNHSGRKVPRTRKRVLVPNEGQGTGADGGIRTCDILPCKEALYRAACPPKLCVGGSYMDSRRTLAAAEGLATLRMDTPCLPQAGTG